MSSPIERNTGRRAAKRDRSTPKKWLCALALAAASSAMACSSHDEVVVTITRDAALPEVTTCSPSRQIVENDMGLDLQIVLDRSEGFGSDFNWLKFGLTQVFAETEFRGINVGLELFPSSEPADDDCVASNCGAAPTCGCLGRCGCDETSQSMPCRCDWWSTSCRDDDYVPLVGLSPLHEGLLLDKLVNERILAIGLPTLSSALSGSLRYRDEWEAAHPGRKVTQLVIAGSSWDFCDEDDHLRASEAILSGPAKPKTYIATFNEPDDEDYDRLAVAGRTESVTRIPMLRPPVAPAKELIELFRKIRNIEGRCEYLLPESSDRIDYRNVNLTGFEDGRVFPRVSNAEACARNPMGWYYDAPIANAPTRILTCPQACTSLRAPTGTATAQIQLGCPTLTGDGGT